MALELIDIDNVTITSTFDPTGELLLHCGTHELARYGDHVLIRSSAASIHVTVSAPTGSASTVTHEDDEGELVTWERGTSVFAKPTTDPLEVTLQVAANGTSGAKMKKLKVEAKPGGALPDRP